MPDPANPTPPTPAAPPSSHPASAPHRPPATPAAPARRQFVSFAFYKLLPEFRRLPLDQQRSMLTALADLIEANDRPGGEER